MTATTPAPAEAAVPRAPVDATALLAMPPAELDDLFRRSDAGPIPAGRGRGTLVAYPGTRMSRPAARLGALLWRGKIFDPSARTLVNLVSPLGLRAVRADVRPGESRLDGRPCTVLDYSRTSRMWGFIRDEIREVAPGLYLGISWGEGRASGGRRFLGRFAVSFPPAT
jgi:hypothetical protein